jgi:predicted dehydrogenase
MKSSRIGVGIIGVEPGRSWSAVAHVPALRALPQYEIVALSTRRQESADAAARMYGVAQAFDDHRALVSHTGVDLVVVAVKVPHHLELVTAALEGGKSVYCEWPLGNGLDEAVRMAELAKRQGVRAVVGLQARAAPVINYVRDLIAQNYVGEVLSTTLVGAGMHWGELVDGPNAYTLDRKNGATLLTIPFGHTVDALCYALGEFTEVTALTATRRTSSTLATSRERVPMTTEDQVVVAGRLEGGAVASIHYRGGTTRGTGLLWEINGTQGDLQVTAIGGHAQLFELSLKGGSLAENTLRPLEVPGKYRWAPDVPPPAFNVAQAYVRLADDMSRGTHNCPGFDVAVRRHRFIAAVEASAASGERVRLPRESS